VGAISRYVRPKTNLFAVKFRRILDVLYLQGLQKKVAGQSVRIYVSKNEAVCCEIEMHFGCSLPASFTETVLGTISQFVHPKTKLFEAKIRRILKVLRLQFLQKSSGHNFSICASKNGSGLL